MANGSSGWRMGISGVTQLKKCNELNGNITMKLLNLGILLLVLLIGASCHRNRLKNNEKSLIKQILTEEDQLVREATVRAEREKQLSDSVAKLPKGFRFKENRSIDPQNPPTVIDIAGTRTNPRGIKLSHLFGKVEYIRLEQDPDSTLNSHKFRTIIGSNIYTVSNMGSICQYDPKGHFIQIVCKGNLQSTEFNGVMMVTKEQADQFEGAKEGYWHDNKLFYQYENRPAQKSYLMTFDDPADSGTASILLPGSVESKNLINGKGKIKSELKTATSMYSLPVPYLLNNSMMAFVQRRKRLELPTDFISVISTSGDTLCKFKDNDPIKYFSRSNYRGVDDGNTYYFNGTLHLRQSFNDTIYQLIPPNRLVPKYILNFGNLGIKSANEGIDPTISLKDKLMLQSFLETDRFLFITYSKDYDCPNTAKSGTLKFSRLIYDKKNETLSLLYLDEAPFIAEGKMSWPLSPNINIENDLDGMPFNWPTSITANHKPFSIISGEDLLKFKSENLPIKNIRKNDRIIAIYY